MLGKIEEVLRVGVPVSRPDVIDVGILCTFWPLSTFAAAHHFGSDRGTSGHCAGIVECAEFDPTRTLLISSKTETPPAPQREGRRQISAALVDCHLAAHAAIWELTLFAALAMSAATASGFET